LSITDSPAAYRAQGIEVTKSPKYKLLEQPWVMYLLLGLCALLLRCAALGEMHGHPLTAVVLGDAWSYDRWAAEIAAGDWLGDEVFYQAPAYPYFLAAIYSVAGHDVWTARLVQVVLGSLACVLLALAGKQFYSRRVGLLAGALLAVYPTAIFFDLIIQKASLSNFLLCGLLALLGIANRTPKRACSWFACGVALAALVLARENALILAAAVLLWLLVRFRRHGWRRQTLWAGALVAGTGVLLLPVALRNYRVGGEFHLTTSQFGPNFYIGNHQGADGRYVPLAPDRGHAQYERDDARRLAEQELGRKLTPGEVSEYWAGQAFDFIRENPVRWLALLGKKSVLLINSVEIGDTEDQYSYARVSWVLRLLTPGLHFGTLVPVAILGVCVTWSTLRRTWILHLMAVSYGASVVLFYVFARYRYPLVPLLLLFAAAGLYRATTTIRRAWNRRAQQVSAQSRRAKRRKRPSTRRSSKLLWIASGLVLLGALLANWPLQSPRRMQVPTYYSLANALLREGEREKAIRNYQAALEIAPDHGPAHFHLGIALKEKGDRQAALHHFQEAVRWRPDNAQARFQLAMLELERGQLDSARRQFQKAVRLRPDFAEAHCGLGNTLVALNRPEAAEAHFLRALELDPVDPPSLNGLGVACMQRQKFAAAEKYFRRWIAVEPNSAKARLNLGSALLSQQDLKAAEEQLRKALDLESNSAQIHNNLAIALARQGKREEAIRHVQEALRIEPGYAAARALLQRLQGEQGALR